MSVVNEVIAWLTDPAQWSGPDGIPVRTLQHIWYSLLATAIAAAIALPDRRLHRPHRAGAPSSPST